MSANVPFIDARPLWDYLAASDVLTEADAIFVLGNSSIGPALKAAELWHDFKASHIFMSSGWGNFGGNVVFGKPEATMYTEVLWSHGVPKTVIHVPGQFTTNTLVEAQHAIPFIRSRIGEVRTVTLISRPMHQRRAWATFRRQHPDIEYFNWPCDEDISGEVLPRLVQEVDRLRQYGEKGDIEPQEIPGDIAAIVESLRQHFKMG